jgi:hypothetical protein
VLFIGTQFSNLYTAVDTPARGRVVVCLVFVYLVFVYKYVLGHSRVSQPLNLWLCLLRHLGFLTSPYASPTCRRRRLNSYRLLRRSTPGPQSSHSMGPSPSPSCLAKTSTIYIYYDNLIHDNLINLTKRTNQRESRTQPSFLTLPLNTIWSFSLGPHTLFAPSSCIHVPLDMFPTLVLNPFPPLTSRPTLLCEVGP